MTMHVELHRMTDHAKNQAKRRGITMQMLEAALSSGGVEYVKGGARHYECKNPPINCVVDLYDMALVTVYWRDKQCPKKEKYYADVSSKRAKDSGACQRRKERLRQSLVKEGFSAEDLQGLGRKALEYRWKRALKRRRRSEA